MASNAALLLQILRHPDFDAVLTTRFLERNFPHGPQPEPNVRLLHTLAVAAAWAASQPTAPGVWGALRAFRLTGPVKQGVPVDLRLTDVSAASAAEAMPLMSAGGTYWLAARPELQASVQSDRQGWRVHITDHAGVDVTVHIKNTARQRWFSWLLGRSLVWDVEHELEHSLHVSSEKSQERSLSATLPGRISEVLVRAGELVLAGAPLLTLEAMKLYHTLAAPLTGRIDRIHVREGDIVAHGQLLLELERETDELLIVETKEN